MVFSRPEITLGRHPQCDVQFDPVEDLQVSIRHALLLRDGDRWLVRDLGSRNGTFVNGHPITTDTRLDDTDQIRLGRDGPIVEFRLASDTVADTEKPQVAIPRPRRTDAGRRESSTEYRVRAEVARQTRRLRAGLGMMGLALVAVVAGALVYNQRQTARRDREVQVLQAQIDSVLLSSSQTIRTLQGRLSGVADALNRSQEQMRQLQGELEQARAAGNRDEIALLSRRLSDAMAELHQRQTVARIDYPAIRDANQRAVAMVWVEYADGRVVTGTAFAIRPDATMITNRHVVAGDTGGDTPVRIGVQFADSEQVFPARVVRRATAPGVDLAVLQVNLGSRVPVVKGINTRPDTLPPGAPVAMIGYPLGTDLATRAGVTRDLATTTLIAGIISKSLPHEIQIHGFGAGGESGSPVFDATGEVIGVVYGGRGSGGTDRIVLAVPTTFLPALLDR